MQDSKITSNQQQMQNSDNSHLIDSSTKYKLQIDSMSSMTGAARGPRGPYSVRGGNFQMAESVVGS